MVSHKFDKQPSHVRTHLIKAEKQAGWLMTVKTGEDKHLARQLPNVPRKTAMRAFSGFRKECGLNG